MCVREREPGRGRVTEKRKRGGRRKREREGGGER